MIQIDHLTKEYSPGEHAVDDLSLQVDPGEIFGFLGPNGAGKTTTIKILTTLLAPTSGSVTVAGYDVLKKPLAARMSFGYVGQKSGVDPALTVSENLILQGRLYHLSKKKIHERMEVLLDLFDMAGREGQWVGSLSGGLKRRLDIATALIHEPKLLFLDEPTLGLDPKSRSDLWSYLRQINQDQSVTLFLTTHYLDEVDQLAHRVGILDMGRIQIVGTPDALKDSLGSDSIQFTFKSPLKGETMNQFRKNKWFKEVIQQEAGLRLYLENARQSLPKVLQLMDKMNLVPQSVFLARPSFDDVYLKYTGKDWSVSDTDVKKEWPQWGEASKNNKWAKKWQNLEDSAGEKNQEWEKWGEATEKNKDWKKPENKNQGVEDTSKEAWSGNEWSDGENRWSKKKWPEPDPSDTEQKW
ncbi:MAG: ABC transporter ATP-binding protein [Nitrospiria bacterium]